MAKSKGKKFEDLVAESCELLGGIQVVRLKDGSARTQGDQIIRLKTNNPSDFILFDGKVQLFLECKSYTGSLPFSDLSQIEAMASLKEIPNLRKGFVIEMSKKDLPVIYKYLSYWKVICLKDSVGKKSINYHDLVKYGYNVETFLPTLRSKKKRLKIDKLMESFGVDL